MDCLFCKIINGEIPSTKVYEDDLIYCFKDINPAADTHVLIVPKAHFMDANAISEDNIKYINHIFLKIPSLAKTLGLKDGYRVITNVGEHGQQSIEHIHFHLIGGEQLKWELV